MYVSDHFGFSQRRGNHIGSGLSGHKYRSSLLALIGGTGQSDAVPDDWSGLAWVGTASICYEEVKLQSVQQFPALGNVIAMSDYLKARAASFYTLDNGSPKIGIALN